jgi:hypothetical protein
MNAYESLQPAPAYRARVRTPILLALFFAFIGVAGYFTWHNQIAMMIVGVLALAAAYVLFRSPELATLIFVLILYTNLAVVAITFHRVPAVAAAALALLPVLPFAHYLIRERALIWIPFGLMLAYFAALLGTSILAKDMVIAFGEVFNFFVEGLILYFLTLNVIRTRLTLRRVVWTMLIAGSLLGSLSLFQELTHSYDNAYWGLAQRKTDIDLVHLDFHEYSGPRSAEGPFGDENRYAQTLIVILPLALYLFREESRRGMKILAAAGGALVGCGILLTFSRGAFIILVFLLPLMLAWRFIRPRRILLALGVIVVLLGVALPEYFDQVESITGLSSVFSSEDEDIRSLDGSLRGRYAQMMAAMNVFMEHPLTGVGPGQFSKYYSRRYGNEIGTKFLRSDRRAHNLYVEIAADMGLFGLVCFMSVVVLILHRLWRVRQSLAQSRPDLARLATALILSILAYLGSAAFLSLAYQRFYWFLLALAGAALQVVAAEASRGVAPETKLIPSP